jgi:hypothetical protein
MPTQLEASNDLVESAFVLCPTWSGVCTCAADAEEGGDHGGARVPCVPHAHLDKDVCCLPQRRAGVLQVLPAGRPKHLPPDRVRLQAVSISQQRLWAVSNLGHGKCSCRQSPKKPPEADVD